MALAAVLLLLAGSLASVAAQGATPTAGGSRATIGGGGGVTPVGTAVTLVDNNGEASATLTVDKLEDPFTGFDPSSAPQRGFHFVAAEVSLFAAGASQVAGNGYFYAVDADGFSYQQSYVYATQDANQLEDFGSVTADPGQVVKGVVYFQVLNNTKIDRLVYQPDYQRWVTVLDLRAAVNAPGAKVSVVDPNGQPFADITATEIIDPLKDFDPSNAPQRGFEFAGVNITVTNTGSAPLQIDPSDFNIVDADGFASAYYGVYRTDAGKAAAPDFDTSAAIDPGKSATGIISFQVLKGSVVNQVLYVPNGRFVEIANAGAKGVQSTATPGPQASPIAATPESDANATDANSTDANSTDVEPTEAAAVPTPDISGVDCDAVASWAQKALLPNITVLTDISTDLTNWESDPTTIDSAKARDDAGKVNDAISAIKSEDAPKEIQPLADAFVGIMQAYADGLKSLADHADAKDTAGIQADFTAINNASGGFDDPNISALSDALDSACPELANLGA
jgi:hypothetical protein